METKKRVCLITCEIFFREVCYFAAKSEEILDVIFLPKGLHDLGGEKMREILQKEIDKADEKDYSRIILGYALCNNGTVSLMAEKTPIIIPRAHDCITVFLGSKEKYQEYFFKNPGTYFHTSGWIERGEPEGQYFDSQLGPKQLLEDYIKKYGEENGRYLWKTLNPEKNYSKIAYIYLDIPVLPDFHDLSKKVANEKNWKWEEIKGDPKLFEKLISGPYNKGEFLIVPPHHKIIATNNENIIDCVK